MNSEVVSLLLKRKITQVNLEKSSTMTKQYFFPPRLTGLTGPKRSICNNSKGLVVVIDYFDLNEVLVCFPN